MALKCLRNPSEAMAPHEECLRILKELKDFHNKAQDSIYAGGLKDSLGAQGSNIRELQDP